MKVKDTEELLRHRSFSMKDISKITNSMAMGKYCSDPVPVMKVSSARGRLTGLENIRRSLKKQLLIGINTTEGLRMESTTGMELIDGHREQLTKDSSKTARSMALGGSKRVQLSMLETGEMERNTVMVCFKKLS